MASRRGIAAPLLLLLGLVAMASAQQARSVHAHTNMPIQQLNAEQEAAVQAFNRKLLAEWRRDKSESSAEEDSVSLSIDEDEEATPLPDEEDDSEDSSTSTEDDGDDEEAPGPSSSSSSSSSALDDEEVDLDEYTSVDTCDGKPDEKSSRSKYPFWLGTAVSAYQVEGAAKEDGRGKSIWDTFAAESGKVHNNDDGSVAIDFYHRYKDDIKMLRKLGIRNFRFSISWPRVLPSGTGKVNQEGIDFYHNLIDLLKKECIEPYVTLYHWDLPQKLYDMYKGWTDDQIVEDFADYAEVVFKEFGSKVKYWSTFNEPYTFCMLGYGWGVHAPGRCNDCPEGGDVTTEPYLCAYNVVRSHAKAAKLFKEHVKDGQLGMNLNIDWAEPSDPEDKQDVEATERHYDLAVRIFADPLYKGDFPSSIRRMVPAVPEFTDKELEELQDSKPDVFYLNHYTSNFIKFDEYTPMPIQYQQLKKASNGTQVGPLADSEWLAVYPQGLRNVLNWVAKEYDDPDIVITENGVNVPGEGAKPSLKDDFRINYFKQYLEEVESAVAEDDVKVKGYFAWTAFDNFEWADGYDTRFGIIYVNFETQERKFKKSATWLASQFGLLTKRS